MRRATKVGGFLVGIGTGVAAVLWMLKDRILRPQSEPVDAASAPAFRVAPPPTPPPSSTDDLTVIKGIGPVYRARLTAAGIGTFEALASAGAAAVALAADVGEDRAAEWIAAAGPLR